MQLMAMPIKAIIICDGVFKKKYFRRIYRKPKVNIHNQNNQCKAQIIRPW